MQHEATVGLNRPAEKHRSSSQRRDLKAQVDALEELLQIEFHGAVDHQTQGTLGAVLGNKHHRPAKMTVLQAGHGQQEVVGEVGGKTVGAHRTNSTGGDAHGTIRRCAGPLTGVADPVVAETKRLVGFWPGLG